MPTLPVPPPEPGIVWRAATVADAPLLAEHTRRIHRAETLDDIPGAEFFEWLLQQPGIEPADDTLVAANDNGIVADTGTWLHVADSGARCITWAETSPGFGHLRRPLLDWATTRARQRLTAIGQDVEKVIRVHVEEHRTAYRDAIAAAGFDSPRSFATMERNLADLPPAPALPPDVTVVPYSADHAEAIRLASNTSFDDHWGSLPMTAEAFAGFFHENSWFRDDLSFVARAGDDVVSLCLCEVDDEDNAERPTNDLYIRRVGTLPAWRGQGLARHLIVRSLEAAASTGGLDRAVLSVDEMNHTDATAVYERLGFESANRYFSYTIVV